MPSAAGVAHDWHLLDRANALVGLLGSGHKLRLFGNDFTPSPASTYSDFVAIYFPPVDGAYDWPQWVVDQTQSGTMRVISDGGHFDNLTLPDQVAYGWFIADSGNNVKYSMRFASPLTVPANQRVYVPVVLTDAAYVSVP